MESEDYWLVSTAFFVASAIFDLFGLLGLSRNPVELGLVSLGFSFLILGLIKYRFEKVKAREAKTD